MRIIKTVLNLVFVILICILYLQNREIVEHVFEFKLDLVFFKTSEYKVYNIAIIVISFIVGVFFTLIFGALRTTGKSKEIKSKDKKIKELENKITYLEKRVKETPNSEADSKSPFSSPTS